MSKKKQVILHLLGTMMFLFALTAYVKPVDAAIVKTGHQKYSYKEYRNDLTALAKKYPKYCRVQSIGKSADNRKIYEVILGNEKAKNHLLVVANLHAREYMTTQLCMKQIELYLSNYNKKINGKKVASVLNKVCIHYVPSANPDGTAISQYGFGAIRNKTLRTALYRMGGTSTRWKANARGVDLNRNWNVAFRKSGRPGSSGYHGTKANSETETKSIVRMVSRIEKAANIVGVVSYHSTGSILYGRCASGVTSAVRKNTARMTAVARKATGYSLMPAESLTYANGCSREYFLYKKKIPCVTVEVGVNPCPLKGSEFSSIWKKNRTLVLQEAMLFD